MQITVQIPQDDIIEAVAGGIIAVLDGDAREPYRVISDAIRDGVAKAISDKLSKNWGDDLMNEIAARVAEATRR